MNIPFKCRKCNYAYKSLNKRYIEDKGIKKWDFEYFCLYYSTVITNKTAEKCHKRKSNNQKNLNVFIND